MKIQNLNIESAYQFCLDIARQHYENFPTASIFLTREQRNATAAIYAFARHADDLADEGTMETGPRLAALDEYQQQLEQIYNGEPVTEPIFIALADTIARFDIPKRALVDLLTAFRMDVLKKRYNDFTELLHYCEHSANPIGELVLYVHGTYSEQNKLLSDRICTALQLINFIQDIAEDYCQRQRIYIPLDEMETFAVTENMFGDTNTNPSLEKLVQYQLKRAKALLLSGAELVDALHGKLKWIITLTLCSGLRVCAKLQTRQNCSVRPTLNHFDWIKIGLHALYFRPVKARAKLLRTLY